MIYSKCDDTEEINAQVVAKSRKNMAIILKKKWNLSEMYDES